MQYNTSMTSIFLIRGKVRHGNKRGRRLGFPTANIFLHTQIPEGVYASTVAVQKKLYIAVTFIGEAKTFGEREYKAEVYLFDFNGNLYDKLLTIHIYKKIRGNIKFNSEKELIERMHDDVLRARVFLRQLG